jgi:hypothetical protein
VVGAQTVAKKRTKEMADEYSKEEMLVMIDKMKAISNSFYDNATRIGCHPFIELTGFMNEYIKIAQRAMNNGIDFPLASTHTGKFLPITDYEAGYIAEKLNCIFGVSLIENEDAAYEFVRVLFDGKYSLAISEDKLRCRYTDCIEKHLVAKDDERVTCATCRNVLGL